MDSGANPALSLIGLWMWLQLIVVLALLLGGIYALYCLGKAAAGLDRLASAVEDLVEKQTGVPRNTLPGGTPVPSMQRPATPTPQPFNPGVQPPIATPSNPFPPGELTRPTSPPPVEAPTPPPPPSWESGSPAGPTTSSV